MTSASDLHNFFKTRDMKMIIAADAEPRVSKIVKGKIVTENPAGGVSVALDSIAQATNAIYIGRAKSIEEKDMVDKNGMLTIKGVNGDYSLKRLFINPEEADKYYSGFSNQTLWPLCHVAFEEPRWTDDWYQAYKKVNQVYAEAIKKAIPWNKKTFIWINDYQLALVPLFLGRPKNAVVSMFWHIPWPTWEVFRILPYKDEILRSMLQCNFLAFHRGYQARNFLQTVERELQVRIDDETQTVFLDKNTTQVKNLPLGIDVDIVRSTVKLNEKGNGLEAAIKKTLTPIGDEQHDIDWYFKRYKVIFGVDRLDYTKGLKIRLMAINKFFEKNPSAKGNAVYIGVLAPSRQTITSYKNLRKDVEALADEINEKYGTKSWKPVHLLNSSFQRNEIIKFYSKAHVCVVTPRDDGMNLVSKEFVVASSMSDNPGMLVLSQFTGSAIDLTQALIVNPYDIDQVAGAIKRALTMPLKERSERINQMTSLLEENNIYEWGENFIKAASLAKTG